MKPTLLLAIAAFLPGLIQAAPAEEAISLPGKIDSVDLYPGSAYVTRNLSVDVPAGQSRIIEVTGIPVDINPSSLQVAVVSGAELLIREIKMETPDDQEDSAELKTLRDEMKVLQRDITREKDQIRRLLEEQNFRAKVLEKLNTSLEKKGNDDTYRLNLEAWDAYNARIVEMARDRETLDDKIEALNEKRDDLQKEINELSESEADLSASIRIEVIGAAAGQRTLALSYLVRNAGWVPVYSLRAEPNSGKLSLEYQAKITQCTSEDWNDVAIHLNTSNPLQGLSPQDPYPIYLNNREAYFAKSSRMSYMESEMAAGPAPMAEADMAVFGNSAMQLRTKAEIVATAGHFTASLPERVSLPKDTVGLRKTILEESMDAQFWSQATPMISEKAYLMGSFTNALELPLLQGEVQCFVDDKLMGTAHMDFTLPGEEQELGLGINENIAITYRTMTSKKAESGLFEKTKVEKRKYETTVVNHMPSKHKVILKDRYPVSKDNKIIVKPSAPKGVQADEEGVFSMEYELAPKEEKSYTTEFEVSYPTEWDVDTGF